MIFKFIVINDVDEVINPISTIVVVRDSTLLSDGIPP